MRYTPGPAGNCFTFSAGKRASGSMGGTGLDMQHQKHKSFVHPVPKGGLHACFIPELFRLGCRAVLQADLAELQSVVGHGRRRAFFPSVAQKLYAPGIVRAVSIKTT